MRPVERRYCEVRADEGDGRTLEGVAVRYGDLAMVAGRRERIRPGAFGDLAAADISLNVQHDRGRQIARTGGGGLVLDDGDRELRVSAELPNTTDARDVMQLVRAGILRGLSIEFRAISEQAMAGVRIIERAQLLGVAVVDTGAYPASQVEARQHASAFRRRVWM